MMSFTSFLISLTQEFTPIVKGFSISNYIEIDLSTYQQTLNTVDISSSKNLQNYIENHVFSKHKKVAFGGYLEKRNLYKRSKYFTSDKENTRNVHLGIDIWCPASTPVLLPLNGKIHSFKNNKNHGDYGPTIIVKHQIKDYLFYTLYGHLSLNSLNGIKIGDSLQQGKIIGYLGDATVNGDYAPHLHFQVIKNLQGNKGDYPGVCASKELDFYKENCPDPNLLLKLI